MEHRAALHFFLTAAAASAAAASASAFSLCSRSRRNLLYSSGDRLTDRWQRRRRSTHLHYIRISNISSDRLKCKASVALPSCTNDRSERLWLGDMVHLLKSCGLRKRQGSANTTALSKCCQIWHLKLRRLWIEKAAIGIKQKLF